jgi:predicted anti-sigma-YlaC factor YlaD
MRTTECDDIDLIAYLEGEQPDPEISRHLESCHPCRRRLSQYQRLTRAMVQSRLGTAAACPHRDETLAAAVAETQQDAHHLATCRECRELAADVAHSLADIEMKAAASTDALPQDLLKRVGERKARWQAEQFRRVLDFQDVKDRKRQDEMTRTFFDSANDALPKAAFPDDLAGTRKPGEEDDEPSD